MSAIALAAPLLSDFVTQHDPYANDLGTIFQPPGATHWLGTDQLGRDTLTRLIHGARVSLGVGFLTVAVLLAVGATVGLVAGHFGGWVDDLLMRIVDIVLAFPAIFLFLLMAIVFRPNAVTLALIIASLAWAPVARLVRGEVLSIRNRDFMLAARSVGASDLRLIVHHLLPNVFPLLIVAASLSLGRVILVEAGLDFLGFGIQPPIPSWGNMLTSAQTLLYHSVWLIVLPGMAITTTVLATNLFGDAARDALDPRLKRG